MPEAERRAEQLLQRAYRYAVSLSHSTTDAEDLVHESWLRVLERYGPDPEAPVLFRTIRNLYIDKYRHRQRYPAESFDEEAWHARAEESDTHVDRVDPQLEDALRRLRDHEREVLFMSVIEGYTAAEIAELTDSPRGTVLSTLHRSRKKLAQWMAEAESVRLRLIATNGQRHDGR